MLKSRANASRRRVILVWTEVILVPAGIGYLLYAARDQQHIGSLAGASAWLLAGLAASLLASTFIGLRLRQVLAGFSIHLSNFAACRLNLQSMFYFVFLPMGLGTEISRFARVRALVPAARAAPLASALVVDRVIGWSTFGLGAAAAGAWVLPPERLAFASEHWFQILAALTLFVAGAGLAGWLFGRTATRRRIGKLLSVSRLHWRPFLLACVFSMLACICLVTGVFIGGLALGVFLTWPKIAFAFLASALFSAIPIMVLGIGAMEIAGVFTYQLVGLSSTQALLMVSVVYVFRLVTAVLGGAWIVAERVLALRGKAVIV